MTERDTTHADAGQLPESGLAFAGEEDTDGRASPAKDLGSACVIGALAVATTLMSLRLDVPGSLYTAPGLLPFVTSLTLLLMALMLGVRGIRAGGADGFALACRHSVADYLASEDGRRALLLIGIVVAYVALVGLIGFELRLPTPVFTLQISSYEVISIAVITWIMKLFWRAALLRCFVVSLVTIEALAAIFRFGFGIIMPESF